MLQIALGGGEPTIHNSFGKILRETRKRNIVPNLTTNGKQLSFKTVYLLAKYAGADRAGFWIPPGEVHRVASSIEQAMMNMQAGGDGIVVVDDLGDPKKADEATKKAIDQLEETKKQA